MVDRDPMFLEDFLKPTFMATHYRHFTIAFHRKIFILFCIYWGALNLFFFGEGRFRNVFCDDDYDEAPAVMRGLSACL